MNRIHNWKQDFAGRKILIIGDVMLDQYIHGHVERISPEAPVPIVLEQYREWRLGGAANVAANIHGLGSIPYMVTVIGNDAAGKHLRHQLQQSNIGDAYLVVSSHRITTVKSRIVGNHQQMLRLDHETTQPLSTTDQHQLLHIATELLPQMDAVLFEDYDKGVISPALYDNIARKAQQLDIPILVDPKLRNFTAYQNSTLFKPNLKELRDGLGIEINSTPLDFEQLRQAVQLLHETLHPHIAMITLSEHGIYATNYSEEYHIPAFVRKVADVSGAGDTTIATTTLALLAGYSLHDILVISNAAAAAVCETPGVIPLNEQLMQRAIEIIEKYQNHDL